MQGLTSAHGARFSVVVPVGAHFTYSVRGPARTERVVPARRTVGPASDYAVDHVEVDGLELEVGYELIVGDAARELDRRRFRALDPGKAHARVAVISCMDDTMGDDARRMWPQVLSQDVDAMLLIGDNVYADHVRAGPFWSKPGPAELWRRYVETRLDLPLYFADTLIPVLATWDDHDFGYNDSNSTYAYREQSRDTFLAFFPQREGGDGYVRGPGVASWWRAFGVEWALTDNRYFRSPNHVAGPEETHYGFTQEQWIKDNLAAARAPVVLIGGDQFFGGYHRFESYQGSHPRSFVRALREWRTAAAVPIAFVSGDRHLSEIIRVPESALGYPTFEITSSGIHSSVHAESFRRSPSPDQLVGVAGRLNYSILELMRTDRDDLQFSVQAFAPERETLYQRTLTVKRR